MITIFPHDSLGHADYDWLKTHYHFSFADYYDPSRTGFGALRVINDDSIKPGGGFAPHPHKDMEIITYVTQGAITHQDNANNKGVIEKGNVQVMSAGTGIIHSEYNLENRETKLFQIWITPRKKGLTPSWNMHQFPQQSNDQTLTLLASGMKKAPLFINQDANIYAGTLKKQTHITHPLSHDAYLVVARGQIKLDGKHIVRGDGVEITNQSSIDIEALEDSELLLIEA
jgi:quercetin 2,3-dioxygenase